MRRVAVPVVLLMLLAACSPAALLNLTAPRAGVTRSSDIAYAPGPDHALDIYAPSHRCADAPVVVFFYGGGWESGSRGGYRFVGASMAARGVVTVIPDYRLYPTVRFPAFMRDAAEAVAWTRAHVAQYGGDPNRLFLMGHSAGGQIATLLALDGTYLRADGVDPRQIRGVIGLAGPYDFLPLRSRTLKAIFGPETEWPRSQPINYVTSAAPPMMLAAGTADDTVDPGNTTRLAARLRQDGVAVDEHLYPGLGHKLLIGAFASVLTSFAPVRRDTLRFIAAHSGAGAGCVEAGR
ncbi:alpha/beta hydrolase [Rhodopila sp.]|uniref:alpha/beta hydrolase n=1 Tax=Rhodopila sp. TaxID=2480087 RepID=UPI003D0B4006